MRGRGGCSGTILFRGAANNLDFVAVHLHGLTDLLSDEMMGKRRHIGDRSGARIRLVFADDPERLATTIVAQNRRPGSRTQLSSRLAAQAAEPRSRGVPRNSAHPARPVPERDGARWRPLSPAPFLAPAGFQRGPAPAHGARIGSQGSGAGKSHAEAWLTSWAASALSSRTNATLIFVLL